MDYAFLVLAQQGYAILAVFVATEQTRLPLPAIPILPGIGALAAEGRISIPAALAIACTAALPGDLVCRRLGAVRVVRALRFLCRPSLEPPTELSVG